MTPSTSTYRVRTGRQRSIVEESLKQEFGRLTVLRFVEYRQTPAGKYVPMVEVECKCGEKSICSLWDVRSGKTRTCGPNHLHYEDRSEPAFNNIYNNSYRKRALNAGLEFTLTKEQFKEITQQACHYCGAAPTGRSHRGTRTRRGVTKTGQHLSQYIYNGLDRKDSRQGYTIENVVPCCGVCNHAKHTMSYEDFIAWLDRVTEFRQRRSTE